MLTSNILLYRALRESALASLEKVEGQLREAKGGRRENERETRAEQTLQDLQRRFSGMPEAGGKGAAWSDNQRRQQAAMHAT